MEFPEKLIFSAPVASHSSYFYTKLPFAEFNALNDISGVNICTRRGYIYPTLIANFTIGKLQRVDSSSQLSTLNMVKINRCVMAVMHEFNALPIFSPADFQGAKIYQSPFAVDIVDLSIILSPKLDEVKYLLDKTIIEMRTSGQLEKSLAHLIETVL